jgi:hypothetical protein
MCILHQRPHDLHQRIDAIVYESAETGKIEGYDRRTQALMQIKSRFVSRRVSVYKAVLIDLSGPAIQSY